MITETETKAVASVAFLLLLLLNSFTPAGMSHNAWSRGHLGLPLARFKGSESNPGFAQLSNAAQQQPKQEPTRESKAETARQAFAQAQELSKQGTAQSVRKAIEKYQEALEGR